MAVRSTTARRLATVIVATAAVSAVGTGAASAATSPAPTTVPLSTTAPAAVVPPLSVPQVGVLLNNLLGTVDGLLGTELGTPTTTTEANKSKPVLERTVDNLTGTTKELPLVGGVVGGLTDGLGLSEPTKTSSHPTTPTTAVPSTPTTGTGKGGGKHHRVDSIAPAGSTWTAPMVQQPAVSPVVGDTGNGGSSRIPHIIREVGSLLPSNAAEAAAAGAGAATIALIVLGGIAVTGAAGAASAAGRRGLINGSVGGSL
ncbi:MAG TPA: hypothetical protein VNC22_05295 [Sporichthya sp.]|nr:hypothetical protein [Sporichthya sp.]